MKSKETYAVVAFSLPSDFFPEDDDICATAGLHIAHELGRLLTSEGHSIPAWAEGGCQEDAWVHLESEKAGCVYSYDILFFPRPGDTQSMAVTYGPRAGFWQGLLRRHPLLSPDDPIRKLMKNFAERFIRPEVLTAEEFSKRN